MSAALVLHSAYHRRPRPESGTADAAWDWFGTFDLVLATADGSPLQLQPGAQLALWCQTVLRPGPDSNARVTDHFTGHVVLEPVDAARVAGDGRWVIDGLRSRHPARHANDGPEAAYVIGPDGSTTSVEVLEPTTSHVRQAVQAGDRSVGGDAGPATSLPNVVPMPRRIAIDAAAVPVRLRVASPIAEPVVALAARLAVDAFGTDADRTALDVDIAVDPSLPAGHSSTRGEGGRCAIVAADEPSARHALVTLAQLAASGMPERVEIDDHPAFSFRGVHLDLARRWYEPSVVGRLIDLAAWRKATHVHLHLTDDEAWRFPVAGYPALAEVGGVRGHGLPIPPVCGSGEGPYGRAYTATEIADWVARADELGLVLVPEVDVPGHCFAALAAVPTLRDPDDTSRAASVQGFVDNALVPGHPETDPFLRAVFTSLAELFPSSPIIHIGGDEVPAGAWSGSPLAQAYAAERGLTTTAEIEAEFHRDLIETIRETTGRQVAAWEEVGLSGVAPGAYAVAWTSADAGRRLVDAGHHVVMAPGQAYYLDMAADHEWASPGTVWAGTVPLATTCEFDPLAGIPAAADTADAADTAGGVIGVQACMWSEHVASLDILDELVFPRLDAVLERGWRGSIAGGPASLAARADHLPRFTR